MATIGKAAFERVEQLDGPGIIARSPSRHAPRRTASRRTSSPSRPSLPGASCNPRTQTATASTAAISDTLSTSLPTPLVADNYNPGPETDPAPPSVVVDIPASCRGTAAGPGAGAAAAGAFAQPHSHLDRRRPRVARGHRRRSDTTSWTAASASSSGRSPIRARLPFAPQSIPLDIVYEDAAIIVVDKPAGLVVHPGSGNWDGTLANALLHHAPELAAVPRAGIVHRLDKDTSGLLVVAKTTDRANRAGAATAGAQRAPRIPGARHGRHRARRHRRRTDRPASGQAHVDGGRRDRQTGGHALRSARAPRRLHAARLPPRNRTHAPDSRPPRVDRASARRRSRVRTRARRSASPSRARRCMRGDWDSCIRRRIERCSGRRRCPPTFATLLATFAQAPARHACPTRARRARRRGGTRLDRPRLAGPGQRARAVDHAQRRRRARDRFFDAQSATSRRRARELRRFVPREPLWLAQVHGTAIASADAAPSRPRRRRTAPSRASRATCARC